MSPTFSIYSMWQLIIFLPAYARNMTIKLPTTPATHINQNCKSKRCSIQSCTEPQVGSLHASLDHSETFRSLPSKTWNWGNYVQFYIHTSESNNHHKVINIICVHMHMYLELRQILNRNLPNISLGCLCAVV